jgi:hypothetical protein
MRIMAASAVATAVVVLVGLPFPPVGQSSDTVLAGRLVAQVGAGALTYLALARALRITEVRDMMGTVRRLIGARSS